MYSNYSQNIPSTNNYSSISSSNFNPYNQYRISSSMSSSSSNPYINNSSDRIIAGGFLGPFILGGITGGLVAPYFYGGYGGRYYNNYYYPYYPNYYYRPF